MSRFVCRFGMTAVELIGGDEATWEQERYWGAWRTASQTTSGIGVVSTDDRPEEITIEYADEGFHRTIGGVQYRVHDDDDFGSFANDQLA